jgi:hypothetical protein
MRSAAGRLRFTSRTAAGTRLGQQRYFDRRFEDAADAFLYLGHGGDAVPPTGTPYKTTKPISRNSNAAT